MSKSYRFRTTPGKDRNIRLNIEQDFDFIEILSLKLKQEDVYTRFCADYGVVAGRVIVNGGYGVPNASVSIFVPLSAIDENDPIISTLYPYKTVETKNEDGYRYNLLPYVREYNGHTPTGTFPDREDLLTRPEVLEVYEKYYKYTVRTNESGDFMIVGVPLGNQKIVLDLDLSNIGCFSLRPSDLIRMNMGVESQFAGSKFRSSSDLSSLPQIVNVVEDIEVASFWGEQDLCNVGITRLDFDLRDQGIEIQPQCVFMGSMFSTDEKDALLTNCKPKFNAGNLCDLVSAPGRILAVRQTIFSDSQGYPVLEQYNLPEGGNVIDDEGTWLIEVPMNLDYVTTNEFGEQILSNDPSVGVPTKGKYRFRIQYQNEGGEDDDVQRADYLVPNIREYGWNQNANATGPSSDALQNNSYAFSLDWNDYGDTGTTLGQFMIQEAIDCKDKFFEFNFNRVYTISSFIDRWKWGYNRARHLGIKEITDRSCTTTTNRMPVNDGVRNFDLIFTLFNIAITIFGVLAYVIIPILHFVALTWPITKNVLAVLVPVILGIISVYFVVGGVIAFPAIALGIFMIGLGIGFGFATVAFTTRVSPFLLQASNEFRGISLPSLSYPDCETCACDTTRVLELEADYASYEGGLTRTEIRGREIFTRNNSSYLIDCNSNSLWSNVPDKSVCETNDDGETLCSGENDQDRPFCKLNQDAFNINKENRYILESYGLRYSLAGYPNYRVKGTPINRLFWPSGNVYFNRSLPLSHRLNWINIRERYFDTAPTFVGATPTNNIWQNKITTTVKNGNLTSDPFTDNVIFLLCDPDTLGKLSAGSLITFTNPDNVDDKNVNGYNVSGNTMNQFGTNSITGTSFTNLTTTISYIKDDQTTGIANLYLTGSTTGRTYNYKGGLEYFQVLTGFTMEDLTTSTQTNPSIVNQALNNFNIVNFGILNASQRINFRESCNNENPTYQNVRTLKIMGDDNWKRHVLLILNRGVDVFTEKQDIEYDLSTLLGRGPGSVTIKGNYHLNIPIQNNSGNASSNWWSSPKTPESHEEPYSSSTLYHKPFNFRPDPILYSAFTTDTIRYYSALDKKTVNSNFKSLVGDNYGLATALSSTVSDNFTGTKQEFYHHYYDATYDYAIKQGRVEGGSFMYMNLNIDEDEQKDFGSEEDLSDYLDSDSDYCTTEQDAFGNPYVVCNNQNVENFRKPRLFAPAYHKAQSPLLPEPNLNANIQFINTPSVNNVKLVLRSDRLPTSDTTQNYGNNGYALYQNDNFSIYLVDNNGDVEQLGFGATDETGNANDFEDDGTTGATSVLSTFSCEGMVPLDCYSGNGETFGVETPCTDNTNPIKVFQGCYMLVRPPYWDKKNGLARDYKLFQEWKTRYRFTFGACRGIISHVFQNNWVNGTLYSFSFKRQRVFDGQGNVKKYIYCGSKDFNFFKRRRNQGTVYWDSTKNSFFYRSTPYVLEQNGANVTGYFIGQKPQVQKSDGSWEFANDRYKGMNDRNIFYPTTIMDLGPRDQFAKEICLNPQLDNYLAETLKSTSFNDTDDLLLFFILSRILSTKTWSKVVNTGDSSINNLFSRSERRLDGDLAQLFSINSEFGVLPFDEQFYSDDDIILDNPADSNNSLIGVLFSADTATRVALTPGIKTFSNGLTQLIGYPKTQVVPMYKWQYKTDEETVGNNGNTIFGTQYNDWKTDLNVINNISQLYSAPYQNMSFTNVDYFKPVNGPALGYLMNYKPNGVRTDDWLNGTNQAKNDFVVGAPYHFYFGLGKGKSALNRYIKKYVIGIEL